MQPRTVTAKVGAIVWATGWKPYDATKIENLGFGRFPNVITNVMMERLASQNGPTEGKIVRPSDGRGDREDRLRAVRRLARREPSPVLLGGLLSGLDEAGHLRPRALPGRGDPPLLHRRPRAGSHGRLLHEGPAGREVLLPPGQGRQDHRGLRTATSILEAENTLTGEITQDGSRPGGPGHGHGAEHGRRATATGDGLDEFGFIVPDATRESSAPAWRCDPST